MQDDLDISKRVDSLRELMEKHLGIKARSFEKACNRAGRQLPRRLRGPAARLIEAASMAENPKLQRYMDATAVAADYRAIEDWLIAQDQAEAAKTRRLNLLALIALQLLVILALTIAFMRWRGLI